MPAFRPRLRALVVGAAAVALVTIGAGGTLAASTPTVWACFNANGQVAMATIPQCKLAGGGQLVQVNAAGVPGPMGPSGATGPQGPTGPTGAAGAMVTEELFLTNAVFPLPVVTGPGGASITVGCLTNAQLDSIPVVGFDSPVPVYVSGPGFIPGVLLSTPMFVDFTGQSAFQAAGNGASVAAIVTAVSLGPSNGCRFIVTH